MRESSRTRSVLTCASSLAACVAVVACAPAARSVPQDRPAAPALARQDAAARWKATPATLAMIRLTTDPDAEGRVLVELRLEGALSSSRTLVFQPSHEARIADFSARDSTGELEVRATTDALPIRFELARAATGALEIRYRVIFGAKGDVYSPYAEPIELSVGGEDVLVLPVAEERFPVEIHLKTGGVASGGASSFALGADQRATASTRDLRGAYFFAGDVGTAAFHGSDGDDFGAWIGFTKFDPRWVSAELAGIRSAVDAYVGRMTSLGAPPNAFLFTATRRDELPLVVSSRTRGLVVSVDRRATWSPAVRILSTQALVRRYLGGFLWVGDRSDEASGAFFSEGFSRTVARELLFDSTWLSAVDRAVELNTLLAAVAFADDPRGLVMARGALVATALDVALQKASNGQRSLKTFLRERLAAAAKDSKDTISNAEFAAAVREEAGATAANDMAASLQQGAEVKLPSELMGPCFRLAKKELVQFELGFVSSSDAEMKVVSVKAGSRAEAAGVRAGDVVTALDYAQGRSGVPVKMTVLRLGRKVPLRFLPAGASRPGRQFERVPGAPDDRC